MEVDEFRKRLSTEIKLTNESLLWRNMPDTALTRAAAQTFVKQFGLFTRHSRQCWANVVGNCPHLAVRRFIVSENLWEEEANEETSHFELLLRMGKALGLSDEAVIDATPTPATQVSFLAWEALTRNRPWIEGLAAKMVLEQMNQADLGNLSGVEAQRWKEQLDLNDADVEFWSLHAVVDQEHGGKTLEMIEGYANAIDFDRAFIAAKHSIAAWKSFWDGIALSLADGHETT